MSSELKGQEGPWWEDSGGKTLADAHTCCALSVVGGATEATMPGDGGGGTDREGSACCFLVLEEKIEKGPCVVIFISNFTTHTTLAS